MASSTTSSVYIQVIEDVISKVREEFINNGGPGEGVLNELQGLDESEKRLEETQRKLARLRSRGNAVPSTKFPENVIKVKEERRSCSPPKTSQQLNQGYRGNNNSSKSYMPDHPKNAKHEQRPQLVIPAVNPKHSAPIKMAKTSSKPSSDHSSRPSTSVPTYGKTIVKEKGYRIPPEQEGVETQSKGTKRKFVLWMDL